MNERDDNYRTLRSLRSAVPTLQWRISSPSRGPMRLFFFLSPFAILIGETSLTTYTRLRSVSAHSRKKQPRQRLAVVPGDKCRSRVRTTGNKNHRQVINRRRIVQCVCRKTYFQERRRKIDGNNRTHCSCTGTTVYVPTVYTITTFYPVESCRVDNRITDLMKGRSLVTFKRILVVHSTSFFDIYTVHPNDTANLKFHHCIYCPFQVDTL